jgi:hypothetical protein
MFNVDKDLKCFKLKSINNYFYCADFYRNDISYTLVFVPFYIKQNDTTILINTPKLIKGSQSHSVWDFKYYYCDELCNGHYIDYYKNGNLRLKGNFRDGFPVGKLYYFDKNGILVKTEKYNRTGRLKKTINYE